MPTYAITMLAAGIGIPVLAAMNAALGRYLGAPMLAGAILLGSWLSHCASGGFNHRARCYCKTGIRTTALTFAGILVAFMCYQSQPLHQSLGLVMQFSLF